MWSRATIAFIMPRFNRNAPGGMVFHVHNRAVGRMRLFTKPADYVAFEEVIAETLEKVPMRICSYCLMSDHWHFVLWPEHDGDLAAFMKRLTVTHVRRWQQSKQRVGEGHLYQGRFKSFPVEQSDFFCQIVRFVEQHALRSNLVEHAEDWQWSSLWRREKGTAEQRHWLSAWPVARPRGWLKRVNKPLTEEELEHLRRCVTRGQPLGSAEWVQSTAEQLGMESTIRARGRPRKLA
ncbi:MAG: putative transposase for insertion sequence element [Planctomycetaceae bacterium]|nr:putative transposase for insertion sequence element [Planctomycetaceae bacterium]